MTDEQFNNLLNRMDGLTQSIELLYQMHQGLEQKHDERMAARARWRKT